jgi:hypothetical protein
MLFCCKDSKKDYSCLPCCDPIKTVLIPDNVHEVININGIAVKREDYEHYVVLENYYKQCISKKGLIQLGQTYYDTCKTNLPISGIIFIDPLQVDVNSDFEGGVPKYGQIMTFSFDKKGKVDCITYFRFPYEERKRVYAKDFDRLKD